MPGLINPNALNAKINSWAAPAPAPAPTPLQQPFKIGNTQYNNVDHFTAQFDKMPKAQKVALYNALGSQAQKSSFAKGLYDHLNSQGRSQKLNGWQQAGKTAGDIWNATGGAAINDAANLVGDFGNAAATDIREFTGQNAKQQQAFNANQADTNKTIAALSQRAKQTNDPAAKARYQNAIKTIIGKSNDAQRTQNSVIAEQKAATDPRKTLTNAAEAGLDIATLGKGAELMQGGKLLLKQGLKGAFKTGTKDVVQGGLSLAAKQTGKTVAKSVAKNAAVGSGIGTAYSVNDTARNPNAKFMDYVKNAAPAAVVGGALGAGAGAAGEGIQAILNRGHQARLDAIHSTPVSEDLTHEQVRGMTPQSVRVDGNPDNGTPIGVKSPTKIGVKDVSTTDKVQVRTPEPMTQQEYAKEFSKISQSYDRSTKYLHTLPPAQQHAMQQAIDTRHQRMLADLEDHYKSSQSQVPEGTSKVTKLTQSTTKAPKNTGGTPKGFVNTDGKTTLAKPQAKTDTIDPTTLSKQASNSFLNKPDAKFNKPDRFTGDGYSYDEAATGKTVTGKDLNGRIVVGKNDKGETILKDGTHLLEAHREKGIPIPARKVKFEDGASMGDMQKVEKPATPTGTGTKTSGGANKAEQRAIANELADHFENKATYKGHSYKEETAKAVDLAKNDPKQAMDIAMNRISGDNAVHEVAVAKAVEQKALRDGDTETLRQLALSDRHTKTSEAAQRLGAEGYRKDMYSPVSAMKDILAARKVAADKRLGMEPTAAVAKETKNINAKVKQPSKDDWNFFVESIKC